MKQLKTIAFVINDESYPLAVGLLPAAFAKIPRKQTMGWIVVVNDLSVLYFTDGASEALEVTNTWMTADTFYSAYTLDAMEPFNIPFSEVEPKYDGPTDQPVSSVW